MKTMNLTAVNRTGPATGPGLVDLADKTNAIRSRANTLFRSWIDRASGRKRLAQLSDQMLNDIGLDRDEARSECAKPFWRA